MPLSEQVLGGFKTGMTRGSRRGGKEGAQKLWTLQNGWVNDQGDVVPRPGLQHVANVANSAGLYGADGQLHVFHSGEEGFIQPANPLVQGHILRYPLSEDVRVDPTHTAIKYLVVESGDTADYSGVGFNDSSWATGLAPFSNVTNDLPPQVGFPADPVSSWPLGTWLWYRQTIAFDSSKDVSVAFFADDGATFWVNGVFVYEHIAPPGSPGVVETFYREFTIPAAMLSSEGTTLIAMRSKELYGSFSYFCFRMTQ